MEPLNRYFDHTNLKADATETDIANLCREALQYQFFGACVNSCHVPLIAELLSGVEVKVISTIGFPLGTASTSGKLKEAETACADGADELDMVINIAALKDGRYDYVKEEIAAITATATKNSASVKVILETCALSDTEIIKGCELSIAAGAAYVKTSTGFQTCGATPHSVALIKKTVGNRIKIKASGGIRDILTVNEMITLGADRIGSSSCVSIMRASN